MEFNETVTPVLKALEKAIEDAPESSAVICGVLHPPTPEGLTHGKIYWTPHSAQQLTSMCGTLMEHAQKIMEKIAAETSDNREKGAALMQAGRLGSARNLLGLVDPSAPIKKEDEN